MTTENDLYRGCAVTVDGHGPGNVVYAENGHVQVVLDTGRDVGVPIDKVTVR